MKEAEEKSVLGLHNISSLNGESLDTKLIPKGIVNSVRVKSPTLGVSHCLRVETVLGGVQRNSGMVLGEAQAGACRKQTNTEHQFILTCVSPIRVTSPRR